MKHLGLFERARIPLALVVVCINLSLAAPASAQPLEVDGVAWVNLYEGSSAPGHSGFAHATDDRDSRCRHGVRGRPEPHSDVLSAPQPAPSATAAPHDFGEPPNAMTPFVTANEDDPGALVVLEPSSGSVVCRFFVDQLPTSSTVAPSELGRQAIVASGSASAYGLETDRDC